uniref:NADAR domain-containing protein n=1 Tax=Meloidogyne enterolobii TaxID=390850 RepID=A0A6V7TN62_MELEN|nr:unnamed protein product [Meloidogyne enterolobii]
MAPTKRKADTSEDRPSSSISNISSSSKSPTDKQQQQSSPSTTKNSIYKKRGQRFVVEDSTNMEKFIPCAIIKEGELVDLELEGKKNKIVRRILKEAKGNITIYMREGDNDKRIVPFFREASIFSNFHPVTFNVASREFCCNEQFFHYCKAISFGDRAIADKIMQTKSPKSQKLLGRRIEGFDPSLWEPISILAMVIGLMRKFQQNESIRKDLLATGDAELIEASPFDAKWGAGIGANQIIAGEDWEGTNFLGRTLMAVRNQLLSPNEETSEAPPVNSLSSSPITEFATNKELCLATSLINDFGIVLK